MNNSMRHIMGRLDMFEAMKLAVGRALTPDQQTAVSARIVSNQAAFLEWLNTERGRAGMRVMADSFIGDTVVKEKAPTPATQNATSTEAQSSARPVEATAVSAERPD